MAEFGNMVIILDAKGFEPETESSPHQNGLRLVQNNIVGSRSVTVPYVFLPFRDALLRVCYFEGTL